MSNFSNDIDAKILAEELQSAIEQDRRYWQQNDAKIRACTTSKNYDEFREYVAAAHLTPLDKKDKNKRYSAWNTVAGRNSNSN